MAAGYTKHPLVEPHPPSASDAGNTQSANQSKSVTDEKMCYQMPYLKENSLYGAKFRYLFTFYKFV